MSDKIVVICPYFGNLPEHFQLWLDSCSYNENFEFIVITDDMGKYNIPKNVSMIHKSWNDLRSTVIKSFDFPVCLETPYKLCDYKPAYGLIFQDLLLDCSYWGYCDLDLIWGDLNKFIPWDTDADKYSIYGHLSLIRNTDTLRQLFKKEDTNIITYKDIFTSRANFGFDELEPYGINSIFEKNGYKVVKLNSIADISPIHGCFFFRNMRKGGIVDKNKKVFSFNSGKIFSYSLINCCIEETEFMYLHFQKRKMQYQKNSKDNTCFLVIPNRFIDSCIVNMEFILANWRVHNYFPVAFRIKMKAGINKLYRLFSLVKIAMKKRLGW